MLALREAMQDFVLGRCAGGGPLSPAAQLALATALVPPLLSAVDGLPPPAALEQLLDVVGAVAAPGEPGEAGSNTDGARCGRGGERGALGLLAWRAWRQAGLAWRPGASGCPLPRQGWGLGAVIWLAA